MSLMIDTSHVGQGFLPLSFFQAARAAGVTDFCVKAGGADDGLYKDAAHDQSVAYARQVGGRVHHYFFNGPAASPAECADAFYQYANPQPGDTLWWDIEPETGMPAWSESQIAVADAQLVAEGRTIPGDYLNESEIRSGQWNTRAGDPLWEAAYISGAPTPGAWGAYQWWQYTDTLNIAGISVDASVPGTPKTTNVIGGEEDMPTNVRLYLYTPTNNLVLVDHLNETMRIIPLNPDGTSSAERSLIESESYTSIGEPEWSEAFQNFRYITSPNLAAGQASIDVNALAAALKPLLPDTLTDADVAKLASAAATSTLSLLSASLKQPAA